MCTQSSQADQASVVGVLAFLSGFCGGDLSSATDALVQMSDAAIRELI